MEPNWVLLKVIKPRKKYLSGTVPKANPFIISQSYLKLSLPTSSTKTGLAEPCTEFQPVLLHLYEDSIKKDQKEGSVFKSLRPNTSSFYSLCFFRSSLILPTGLHTLNSRPQPFLVAKYCNTHWALMESVFLITHMRPEDKKTSKNSIPLESKWKITLQSCFQANKDEQSKSGEGKRREGRLWETMNRGKKKRKP